MTHKWWQIICYPHRRRLANKEIVQLTFRRNALLTSANTGLGNETGKFQNIKKIDT